MVDSFYSTVAERQPHLQQSVCMTGVEFEEGLSGAKVLPQCFLSVHQPSGAAAGGQVCLPRQGQRQRWRWGHPGVTVQEEKVAAQTNNITRLQNRLSVDDHPIVCDSATSKWPHQSCRVKDIWKDCYATCWQV